MTVLGFQEGWMKASGHPEAGLESSESSPQHSVRQNKSQSCPDWREGGIDPTVSWKELQINCVYHPPLLSIFFTCKWWLCLLYVLNYLTDLPESLGVQLLYLPWFWVLRLLSNDSSLTSQVLKQVSPLFSISMSHAIFDTYTKNKGKPSPRLSLPRGMSDEASDGISLILSPLLPTLIGVEFLSPMRNGYTHALPGMKSS